MEYDSQQSKSDATAFGWFNIALGFVTAVIGLVLMFNLFTAVRTLAFVVAFGLIFSGINDLIRAGDGENKVFGILIGALSIITGVVAAGLPGLTLWYLALVVGIGFIVTGAFRLIAAFMNTSFKGWGWLAAWGAATVILGILAVAWPGATVLVLAILLGVRLFVAGAMEMAVGYSLVSGAKA